MHIRHSPFLASDEDFPPAALAGQAAISSSFAGARHTALPFPYLALTDMLPPGLARALVQLPFAQPAEPVLGRPRPIPQARGDIGMREVDSFSACRTVVASFQAPDVIAAMTRASGADLRGCGAQITLVREVDGYTCAPRTGCAEARLTLMVALDTGNQIALGPDIYFETGDWACQIPWRPGCGVAFAPSPRSWHGFEPRMIRALRTSLIVDYAPDTCRNG